MLAPEHVDRLYREAFGRSVGVLVARYGDLGLAEECVQDAFAAGLERWPREGLPRDVTSWIATAASHRAVDRLRRARIGVAREREALTVEAWLRAGAVVEDEATAVPDERLRLMFMCCHPLLAVDAQVALTLRLVAGLRLEEVARALLRRPDAIAQRLVRAKRTLRGERVSFGLPADDELAARLPAVLAVLYLIFNEGHASTAGAAAIRVDLCDEAIRLARIVVRLAPDEPEPASLLALMLLNDARRAARYTADGALIQLEHHERRRYDANRVREGTALVQAAFASGPPGAYALQAAIAAAHCHATGFADTPWPEIVALYDRLVALTGSPVAELNRAAAISYRDGPAAALALVEPLAADLEAYAPFHATLGDLHARLGDHATAREAFARAAAATDNQAERAFLLERAGEPAPEPQAAATSSTIASP